MGVCGVHRGRMVPPARKVDPVVTTAQTRMGGPERASSTGRHACCGLSVPAVWGICWVGLRRGAGFVEGGDGAGSDVGLGAIMKSARNPVQRAALGMFQGHKRHVWPVLPPIGGQRVRQAEGTPSPGGSTLCRRGQARVCVPTGTVQAKGSPVDHSVCLSRCPHNLRFDMPVPCRQCWPCLPRRC